MFTAPIKCSVYIDNIENEIKVEIFTGAVGWYGLMQFQSVHNIIDAKEDLSVFSKMKVLTRSNNCLEKFH